MEKTRNRKTTTSKKAEEQATKTNTQENLQQVPDDSTDTNAATIGVENINTPKNIETPENKKNEQDVSIKMQKPKKPITPFVTSLANRIMTRIYELYGHSIKGETCKEIVSQAQKHAKAHKITIKTDIEKIDTHELYEHIVQLISDGYNISPLDANYNDIFLKAVVERYKV